MREVAQLLHRVLEVGAELVEHRLGRARGRCRRAGGRAARSPPARRGAAARRRAGRARSCGARRRPRRRCGRATARSSSACRLHLVERLLQRGVELHVVQREADLAGELGEHAARRPRRTRRRRPGARTTISPSSSPEFVIGRDAQQRVLPARRAAPAARPRASAGPTTPARATTGLLGLRARPAAPARDRAPTPLRSSRRPSPVHTSAPLEHQRLPQRLGQLQQQLVERDRAGEAAAERAQHLVGRVPLAVHEPVRERRRAAPASGRQSSAATPAASIESKQDRPLVVGRARGRGRARSRGTPRPRRPSAR